jgi:hypothetical protein
LGHRCLVEKISPPVIIIHWSSAWRLRGAHPRAMFARFRTRYFYFFIRCLPGAYVVPSQGPCFPDSAHIIIVYSSPAWRLRGARIGTSHGPCLPDSGTPTLFHSSCAQCPPILPSFALCMYTYTYVYESCTHPLCPLSLYVCMHVFQPCDHLAVP